MKIKKQIEIVKTLTEAVYEIGEFQRGWEKEIEKGEKLLKYLEEIEKEKEVIDPQ